MANKKITELTELTAANIANNDVLAIVDVGGDETKKVAISSLYDIFDNNVTIDTGKLVFGLTGANTNISALSVNTLPLIGGTVTGPVVSYSINSSSNVSIAQSLAIGYVDHRVPQANLDVKNNVYIGGATTIAGALTLGTDLAVAQGGTGASSLTDGGVLLGSGTSAITAMGVLSDGQMIVGDGSTDPVAESGDTLRNSIGVGSTASGTVIQVYSANASGNVSIGRSLAVGYTDGRVPQANLEVKGNAHITGATTIAGALTLGTDLAVAQGGTGASSLTDGGVLLGSGTSAITAMGVLGDGEFIVGDGTTDPVAESGATLRTSIGVGTGDSPQFTAVNIGAATDTTVARASAGDLNVEGNLIYRAGGTDVPVADGGTGASSLTDGGVLLGSGTNAITAMGVLSDGQMIVGDGSTDPVAESGATLRTSIGVGTGDSPQFLNVTVSGNLTVKGNNFIVHANNLVIDDPIISLAANLKSSQAPADDTGILLNRGNKSNVFAGYDESSNTYVIAYTPTTANSSPIDIGSYSTTRVGALTADSLTLGTDLAVAQGGTGASSLTDGGVLLGSGTSAITAMGVLSDGQMIVGDGSTDPVAESGATLRTSIGVGTGDSPQFYGANVSGNSSINRSLAVGYTDGRVPRANLEVKGNVFISGNVAIAGATNYPEDVKAVFGSQETGPLQIFHSSGDVSKIEDLSGTSGGLRLRSSSISLRDAEDDVIIAASSTGAFLYHNGNERLKTISGGIIMSGGLGANVSGNVSVSRSLAVGFTDGRIPRANLEVTGNVFIGGQPSSLITGPDTSVTFASGLGVASGGTGAQSFTDGGVLLGSGTSAITAMGVLTDGQMIVGDGSTDPVAESGATLRTSIGVGTGDNVEFTNVTSTGVILAADGAVGAPSITNTGDTNTGIYFPASDNVAISVGGREAIQFGGKARGGLVDSNIRISSNVVNHQGLSTTNYTEYANNIVNAGSSFTLSTGTNVSRYTLDQSHCEITLPGGQPIQPASMKTIILYLKQDGTGGRTVDFNAPGGEALEWNNSASEPEVVSGANKVSIYTFMKFHGDTNWYCSQSFIEN